MKRAKLPTTTPEYQDNTPSAAHDTAEGIARILDWARKSDWYLLPSTRDRALALGIDISGVKFRGPA